MVTSEMAMDDTVLRWIPKICTVGTQGGRALPMRIHLFVKRFVSQGDFVCVCLHSICMVPSEIAGRSAELMPDLSVQMDFKTVVVKFSENP